MLTRFLEYIKQRPSILYTPSFSGIWNIECDIALPCATQNEIDPNSAKTLIANGVTAVCEGANMPCTLEASKLFIDNKVIYGTAKTASEV